MKATAEIVVACIQADIQTNAGAPAGGDLADLIVSVRRALVDPLPENEKAFVPAHGPRPEPAVPVEESITPDYIVCLEDGQKFQSMKRHLRGLGFTPDEYRQRWDLPPDYPMVCPSYSARRSRLAKDSGLGIR